MKSIINNLNKQKSKIIKAVEKRDAYSLNRTDEWQQSEKGINYEEKTGILADATEGINESINQLIKFTND